MSIRIWDVPYAYGPTYAYWAEHYEELMITLLLILEILWLLRSYSRLQNKVNVLYCNYCVITDCSTNCTLPLALSLYV